VLALVLEMPSKLPLRPQTPALHYAAITVNPKSHSYNNGRGMRVFVSAVCFFIVSLAGVGAVAAESNDEPRYAVQILSDGLKCPIKYLENFSILRVARYMGNANLFKIERKWDHAACERAYCKGKEVAFTEYSNLKPAQLDLAKNRSNGKEYTPGIKVDDLTLVENNVLLECLDTKKCFAQHHDIPGVDPKHNANNGKFSRYKFEVCYAETGNNIKSAIDYLIEFSKAGPPKASEGRKPTSQSKDTGFLAPTNKH